MARVLLDGVHDPEVRPDFDPVRTDYSAIPVELLSQPAAVFILEPRPEGGWAKQPRNCQGFPLSPKNLAKWEKAEDCKAAVNAGLADGWGVRLTEGCGIVGWDTDHAEETLKQHPALAKAIKAHRAKGGYVEVSPSGKGLRGFIFGDPVTGRKRGNHVEMYSEWYLTLTGAGSGAILEDQELRDALVAAMEAGTGGDNAQGSQTSPATSPPAPSASQEKPTAEILAKVEAASREKLGDAADRFIPEGEMGGLRYGWLDQSKQDHYAMATIYRKAKALGVGADHLPEVMETVFGRFGLADRAKWQDRADYRERTIKAVVQSEAAKGSEIGNPAANVPIANDGIHGHQADRLNGPLFADLARGQFVRVHETGDILTFGEVAGYVKAPPHAEFRIAEEVIEQLKEAAITAVRNNPDSQSTKRLLSHLARSSTLPKMRDMIEYGFTQPEMTRSLAEFDRNPSQFGCPNGVYDLDRGILLPPSPDLLVTKRVRVPFDQMATAPLFGQFLDRVLPDRDSQGFLQRFVGYCLSGYVNEHIMLFMFGTGANGKSVFIELISWLLGDYSRHLPTELLTRHIRSPQGPSPDIVALHGARMAFVNETSEGVFIDEARFKQWTGGDSLTGRVPYAKEPITFQPTHKLIGIGNYLPNVSDTGDGFWRRMALLRFGITIPVEERDPHLLTKLKSEGAGVLNWAIDGWREYQRIGLAIPSRIMAETAAYRESQDSVLDFLQEHEMISLQPGAVSRKDLIYSCYSAWAKASGYKPMTAKSLTRRLHGHGVGQDPGRRNYVGLAHANPLHQAG